MKNIPRLRFAHLPTPVEALPRLSAYLGGPRLLIKRDDQTGLALGGNKTRKLEFLVAEAQANGARTLVTAGAVQSNHCRQTAAAAARFGLGCILVLAGEQTDQATGNLLMDRLLGADIVWTTSDQREVVLQQTFDRAWETGLRPYLVPFGGSSATGAAAYVYAMKELVHQGVKADWVVLATASGGTQAGLSLGARLFEFGGKILGISVEQEAEYLKMTVASLANATADFLAETVRLLPEDILVRDDYLGGGYGVMGQAEREAVTLFARQEGVLLDPVYTGRAAAGMIDLIRQGYFGSEQTVLFWHTGGAPALFTGKYSELANLG